MTVRGTRVTPLKLPQAPLTYDKGDIDRTRRLIEQLFNEYALGGIQQLSDQVVALEARVTELEGGGFAMPPVPGFTFWYDAVQEDVQAPFVLFTNRSPDAPASSDLEELYTGAAGEVADNVINGHRAVRCTNNDQFEMNHASGSFLPTASYTMFALVDLTAIDDNLAGGMIVGVWPFNYSTDDIGFLPPYQLGTNDATNQFIPCAPLSVGLHVLALVADGAGNWVMYDNGSPIGSGSTLFANGGQWDFRAVDSVTFGSTYATGEVIMYPMDLNGTDRAAVETYLTAKWS